MEHFFIFQIIFIQSCIEHIDFKRLGLTALLCTISSLFSRVEIAVSNPTTSHEKVATD